MNLLRPALLLLLAAPIADAQLFEALRSSVTRFPVGDPAIQSLVTTEGPKSVVSADFDGDGKQEIAVGNADGSLTVLTVTAAFGETAEVTSTVHLQTGGKGLRQIEATDIDRDGDVDLLAAAPFDARLFFFINDGLGGFSRTELEVPFSTRNFVAEDFDGDGDTDLFVAGREFGLQQYVNDGDGSFALAATFEELRWLFIPDDKDPQAFRFGSAPVYPLRTFIPPGKTLPAVVATHSRSADLRVYETDPSTGLLALAGVITPDLEVDREAQFHDFQIGNIADVASGELPDLVGASRNWNSVAVLRGQPEAPYFAAAPFLEFPVATGPRFIQLVDRDADGYNEIFVIQRNGNRLLVFDNADGIPQTSDPVAQSPLGLSPREFTTPDLDGDGKPDIVAINRASFDVSIIVSSVGDLNGRTLSFCTYPTDGSPAALDAADLNADSRDDIIQLHRASGDISIRLSGENGALSQPIYFAMGLQPNQMVVADLNADGLVDISTSNLGQGETPGSLSVRYGTGNASLFGPLEITQLPPPADPTTGTDRLFALINGDFDGDGISDQVAGYYDCRIRFFRGLEDGSYLPLKEHFFVPESRAMVAGDFDQDGDIDLFGVGNFGVATMVENTGDLLETDQLTRTDYFLEKKIGVQSISANDFTGDGDPDFVIGASGGTIFLFGGEGLDIFGANGTVTSDSDRDTRAPIPVAADATAIAVADFDNNGSLDLATACSSFSTLTIWTLEEEIFGAALENIPVPSADFITSGDFDGDGEPDLAGTGDVLWTALSGDGVTPSDTDDLPTRPAVSTVVINEILPQNDSVPLPAASGKRSDSVEIFNGSDTTADLSGWRLRLESPDSGGTTGSSDFVFPQGASLASGDRRVVVFSEKFTGEFGANFKLPGDGAALTLIDQQSE